MPVFEYGISSQFQYLQYANFQIELRNHPWHKVGNSLKPSLQRLVLQVIIFKKLDSYYVFNCFHLARHGVASLNASLQLKDETSHIGKSFQMHDDSWHNHCLMTSTFVPVSCCGLHAQAFISDFISMAAGIDWGYPVLVLALTDFSTGVAGFLVPVSTAEWLNFCFFTSFLWDWKPARTKITEIYGGFRLWPCAESLPEATTEDGMEGFPCDFPERR